MKKEMAGNLELSRREQQDLMDKIILQKMGKTGRLRWTELEKMVLGTKLPFATSQRFRTRMKYLLNKRMIRKIQRGTYEITELGVKYFETLNSIYADFERKFLTIK